VRTAGGRCRRPALGELAHNRSPNDGTADDPFDACRKLGIGTFQFLKADDVGLGGLQPCEQIGQTAVDVVDIEGHDFHAGRLLDRTPFTRLGDLFFPPEDRAPAEQRRYVLLGGDEGLQRWAARHVLQLPRLVIEPFQRLRFFVAAELGFLYRRFQHPDDSS
jgi:hypothetical protein